jgi:DNA replication protein DnaC
MESEQFPGYDRMVAIFGKRHAVCELNNYDVGGDKYATTRKAALGAVVEYAKNLAQNVADGRNMILCGNVGTGKDHLAASIVRVGLPMSFTAASVRGSVLAAEMRSCQCEKGSRSNYPMKYAERDILILSDAEPRHNGEGSEFEQKAFLELIDQRYRDMKPTIITSNVKETADIAKAIGLRALDRLMENCVVVNTWWPSYRQRTKVS